MTDNMEYKSIQDIPNLRRIQDRLRWRGLTMYEDANWEKHGPHPGMDNMVIIGLCYDKDGDDIWVMISEHRIYKLDNPGNWWKAGEEDVIPLDKKIYDTEYAEKNREKYRKKFGTVYMRNYMKARYWRLKNEAKA